MALHGICLVADKISGLNLPCIVVVEGGPKAIKFYKKLLLKRIKWERNMKHHVFYIKKPFIIILIERRNDSGRKCAK